MNASWSVDLNCIADPNSVGDHKCNRDTLRNAKCHQLILAFHVRSVESIGGFLNCLLLDLQEADKGYQYFSN